MSIKLQPTVSTICQSCTHAIVTAFDDDNQIRCRALGGYETPMLLKKPVLKCSSYQHANDVSLHEMREIAWELRISSKGSFIGFKAPEAE